MIKALKTIFSRLFHKPFHDGFSFKGKVKLVLKDKNGKVKTTRVANSLTTAGIYAIADQLLASPTLGKPSHAAVGDNTPALENLGNELVRVALTSLTRNNSVISMVIDLPAGVGTGDLTEAGIFDADTDGNCLATTSFSTIPKGAADTLEITWTWTGSN